MLEFTVFGGAHKWQEFVLISEPGVLNSGRTVRDHTTVMGHIRVGAVWTAIGIPQPWI